MQTPLLPGETVQKEGAANCQRGQETVGGRLNCTNQRLVFESHAINVNTGTTVVELNQIVAVRPVWTKFLGLIPLAPNSFEVQLRDGTTQSFVVTGRAEWIALVERLRAGAG